MLPFKEFLFQIKMDNDGLTIQNTGGIAIPYGGLKISETKLFYKFRQYYRTTYPKKNYPGDISFNIFLDRLFIQNNKIVDNIYIASVYHNLDKDVVPKFDWEVYYSGTSGPGTIVNPKGGRVLKVLFCHKLKHIWGDNSTIPLTDFELNEFLSKKIASDQYFNLETYLKTKSEAWKKFKLRFPDANTKNFEGQSFDNHYNIYYQDTPIEVFGDHVLENKFNDRVKKGLDLSTSFPISLQTILEKNIQSPAPIITTNLLRY